MVSKSVSLPFYIYSVLCARSPCCSRYKFLDYDMVEKEHARLSEILQYSDVILRQLVVDSQYYVDCLQGIVKEVRCARAECGRRRTTASVAAIRSQNCQY